VKVVLFVCFFNENVDLYEQYVHFNK